MDNQYNTKSIKEIMQKVLKKNKLEKGMLQIEVTKAWKDVMGNGVWTYTSSVKLNNGHLNVSLKSSALREELSYGTDKIVKMLNEYLKKEVIKKIRLL
jgi:hypothetical protein